VTRRPSLRRVRYGTLTIRELPELAHYRQRDNRQRDNRQRDNRLGAYGSVAEPGPVAVGDPVELEC